MFLKAINENEIKNSEYIQCIILENLDKLMDDKYKPNKDNMISNSIMSILLNRILSNIFPRASKFKNNFNTSISKYLDNGELYQITIHKKSDFDESTIADKKYLKITKNVIKSNIKNEATDILIEEKFSYERLNYFIDKLNDIFIDGLDSKNLDYYKACFVYLSLMWFKQVQFSYLSADLEKKLDNYLDLLREGIEENRIEIFLTNAKNNYYHLNPYGFLLPIDKISHLIDNMEYLKFLQLDDETSKELKELSSILSHFVQRITEQNIPNYKRMEILEDSDFNSVFAFFEDLKNNNIDVTKLRRNKKIENLIADANRMLDGLRRI